MRVYIAGKWEDRVAVRQLMDKVEALGHTITVDWTNHKYEDESYPVSYAREDIQGVYWADGFIGRFVDGHNYRGALVEMGAALALGKPVAIIGHAIDSCIFVHHPLVRRFETDAELLEGLSLKEAGMQKPPVKTT